MKERETPETDRDMWLAEDGSGGVHSVVSVHVARKLERERDSAEEKLAALEKSITDLSHPTIAEVLAQLHQSSAAITAVKGGKL